jgi:hypothetical protein
MPDPDILKVKRLTDISDLAKRKETMKRLMQTVTQSVTTFQGAYTTRRNELLEINSIYRCKSFYNKDKAQWQTKTFLPLSYECSIHSCR